MGSLMVWPDLPPRAWAEQAACRNADLAIFYPDPPNAGRAGKKGKTARWAVIAAPALAYCNRCPVVEQCKEDAIADNDMHGIRGGLTPPQLRWLRNKARAKHGTRQRYCGGCRCDPCLAAYMRYRAVVNEAGRKWRERQQPEKDVAS